MREELWERQRTNDGKKTRYGLGFTLDTIDGELAVSHGGAQEKVRGYLKVYPDRCWGIVVVTNTEHGVTRKIAAALEKALTEKPESQ